MHLPLTRIDCSLYRTDLGFGLLGERFASLYIYIDLINIFAMCIKINGDFWTAFSAIATFLAVVVAIYIPSRQHIKERQKEKLIELERDLYSADLGEKACNMMLSVMDSERSHDEVWRMKSATFRAYDMVLDARRTVGDREVANDLQRIYAKLYDVRFFLESTDNYQNDKETLRSIVAENAVIVRDVQSNLKMKIIFLKGDVETAKRNFNKYLVWPWK